MTTDVTKPDTEYFAEAQKRDIKTYLMREQPEEKDLYKHLSKVMTHIVKHCPEEGLNKLEEISHLTKQNDGAKIEKYLKTAVNKSYAVPSDEKTAAMTSAVKEKTGPLMVSDTQILTSLKEEKVAGEDGIAAIGNLPDIAVQSRVW